MPTETLVAEPVNADPSLTTPSNVAVTSASSSPNLLVVNLTQAQKNRVREIVSQKSVEVMAPNDIALYGAERQVAFSKSLDVLLAQITKGSSPVLFQMFKDLQRAGEKTDVAKLEADIRASLNTTWFQKLLDTLHLDNVADRIARVNKKIGDSLVSKTTSLLDVMKKMEDGVNGEIQKLITDAMKLDTLAKEFITNGEDFAVSVEAGRQLKEVATRKLLQMQNETNGDMMKVQQAKNFEQKVQLFESRLLILETAYVKSFGNLDAVRLAKGASVTTIAETANSVLSEFTDIKTSLVNLSVAYQIQSVQALNAARRELRAALEKHSTAVLGSVATTAAKVQGDNRLEDAQLLSALVTNLTQIGNNVEQEHKLNQQKFTDARGKLADAQKALAEIASKKLIA